MNIEIVTNTIAGGWHPGDLIRFLGGNEESVVLLAEALARAKHNVTVYTSLRGVEKVTLNGVNWEQISAFNLTGNHDVLITMKDRAPWFRGAKARVKIHWCNDIETPWSTGTINHVDKIVILGTYMQDRMPWIPENKRLIIPLAMDMRPFKSQKNMKNIARDENLAIYTTSPDRGLETLLADWTHIKKYRPELKLFVTYGWKNLETMGGGPGRELATRLQQMLNQPDIKSGQLPSADMVGLMKSAKYYVHPLNRPDSDLFGFGMMKARAAGCILVVPSVSQNGFREMADKYIPYREWITGRDKPEINLLGNGIPQSWDNVVKNHWQPLLMEAQNEAA